ncbi:hypothetical protein ILUMI_09157 [Ignelater luminosus]|uniref:Uncharacterized protein n=1 Tax=Ignelater luminosus TaxID=2038154 RepID=A0A8K0D2Z7_IGNLU|nr:hypothetical protein ILUMI_09157 [Ignelater luminosus]
MLATETKKKIVDEIKEAKIYTVMADPTPDISHQYDMSTVLENQKTYTGHQKHLRIGQIEKKLFVMEFKRNSVIALYLAGKSQSAIVRELEHIKVNRKFVYRTINRYNETGSVVKRYGGGPKKTATSPEMVRKVKKRLEQNPRRSGNQMAKELNISQSSIRRILQNELQVKAYKKQKAHDLTPNQKKVRFERAKELLRLAASGEFPNIVFSDEKNFPIEQFVNTQNDRVYLTERTYENLKHRLVTRSNYPSQIMVWAAVTATGRSPLVFIEPGVKETTLCDYLQTCANLHHGLPPKAAQSLAYELAVANNIQVSDSWSTNKMAGEDWLTAFLKRNKNISIKTTKSTSISRAMGFNKPVVNMFFDNCFSAFNLTQKAYSLGNSIPPINRKCVGIPPLESDDSCLDDSNDDPDSVAEHEQA